MIKPTSKSGANGFISYRSVDKFGDMIDLMPSKHRDEATTNGFFKQAIDVNGCPRKVIM